MEMRESARRVQCFNNLKSIALAINSHLDQKNFFPRKEKSYSCFVFMLPYLEQASLFSSFNLALPRAMAYGPADVNYTAYSTTVSVFVCPSNSGTNTQLGPCSYGGNLGAGVSRYGRPDNGPFASSLLDPKIRDALVRDGLANTVAVSEFCHTQGRATPKSEHAVFLLGEYNRGQFDSMISDCTNLNTGQQPITADFRGFCWAFDGLSHTLYDHNVRQNRHACACNGGALPGAWTASSYHPNGVNCAHLDGHVSFVNETVTMPVWRAMGTIAGGELIQTKTD